MSIPLGPFDLIAPAGRGAMAEVWRAVHRRQGVSVAVKIVTAPAGREGRFLRLFAREVRAVARLDHPSIVRLYDHGELPASMAAHDDPRLPPGAPYLVMAWLGGGSLRTRAPMPWPALRSTLLGLLDGLAHAHARGVVHRDLKIDNVLFGRSGPVLTDFGLAWHADDEIRQSSGARRRLMGTPNYMAPEQIERDDAALGPWTDLYAVGCLAWCLATGRPPFDRPSPVAVLQAHIDEAPPALRTAHPLPRAFEGWVRRLLAKSPGDRFRRAADAAVALLALPDAADGETTRLAGAPRLGGDPSESDLTLVAPPTFVSITDRAWAVIAPDERPPMPETWRGPEAEPADPVLLGCGRALFGLRSPPLFGRVVERDRLWSALREVVERRGARAVVIEGPSGRGKTRLADWLAHRAHELGVATPMRATHGLPRGPACGVGPMLARFLRCDGLEAERRLACIRRAIADDATARGLAALLDPAGRVSVGGLALALEAEAERRVVACRAIACLARHRPMIVQLDDVQWGADTLRLVEHLLSEHPRIPVLVVMTVRTDELRPTSPARRLIDGLVDAHGALRLALGPLDAAAHAALIRSTLPLDEGLLAELVERAAGSPLFAEQAMRRWLETDALESGPRGFRLKAGVETLPALDGQGLWLDRVAAALEGAEPDAMAGFEIAAALGQRVDHGEWTACCAAAGVAAPVDGLEQMLDAQLAQAEPGGFAFTHAMLREALQRQARDAGRRARWNRACAAVLAAADGEPARLAEHLIAADAPAEALAPLGRAIDDALRRGDLPTARRLVTRRVRLLRRLRLRADDRRWIETRVALARMAGSAGEHPRARRWARRAERSARAVDDPALLVAALLARGEAARRMTGRLDEALAALDEAERRAEALGDPARAAEALIKRGTALLVDGRTAEAGAAFAAALARLERLPAPDDALMGEALRNLADTARRVGDHEAAWHHGRAAHAHYRRVGDRWSIAKVQNTLGDLLRHRGDLAGAVRRYEALREIAETLGVEVGVRCAETNLGLVLIELGRYAEARPLLSRALAAARRCDDAELICYLNAALWPCDAARGNWTAWDARRPALEPLFAGRYHDPDAAMVAAHAARLAADAGKSRRAADARALAAAQRAALGRPDETDAAPPPARRGP